MLSFFWNFAAFIVALGILITVHEFGHFWVARRCGVKVERFSIGFGKALWRRYDKQGTEYVIATIPLGGYVKMLDERVASVPPELRHQAFNNKTVAQRMAIIAAGPCANFIFALFAWWLVFIIGVPSLKPVVGGVLNGSVAQQAQIMPGMELKTVDGIETPDWDAVCMALIGAIGDPQVPLSVIPFGSASTSTLTLNLSHWKLSADDQDPLTLLGIAPYRPKIETVLAEVQQNSPASHAGLQAGDRIVSVQGQPLAGWQSFVSGVRDNSGRELTLQVERQGAIKTLILVPVLKPGTHGEGYAGVIPRLAPLPDAYKIVLKYDVITSAAEAGVKTWHLMKLTVSMIGKLITGEIDLNNLSGPVSIAKGAGISADYGLVYYLMFLALISINLGIINLFPLPVLDGGHLLFLAIEKIKGNPVSERVQDVSYRIGSILLVLLMGFALFNDFSRL